ncbi:alpha/beta hydrolase [Actinokineospora auranticolor]|uniref:Pimeloyl-ACP methyl ester carboxylesterase n=1 Tax=Actinokineospora auranticolor TaxID=155976 RepID=A0A2S6GKY7_9PSEU|nr:alpha/beta hydrolase [Actinokineospora auranticolor]PPK65806.1 pimeloyl-ACP methyl ester carboxylesterase [Actinokineospora auranticolor]
MATRLDPSSVRIDGPWAHRDVHANGIRLHVAETGEGPLVLLLHGFAGFWWSWRHQLTALGDAGFRAVAVDLRGYGDSDKPPRGYDAWTLSGDVAGLVKSLGETSAHLVGHDWGGLLAWSVAALHARVVTSVTAVSAPHPLALRAQIGRTALRRSPRNQARALGHLFRAQLPLLPERRLTRDDAAAVERQLRSWSGRYWPELPEAAERYRAAMLVPGVAHSALEYHRWALRSQVRSEGRRYAEAMARRLTTPVLQLYGADDPLVLPRTRPSSTPWIAGHTETHTLPQVGHFPHEEAPQATNARVTSFIKNLRP